MGSTGFVLPSLERLLATPRCDVAAVYTRAPAERGRGHKLRSTPVQERAQALGIPVETPHRLQDCEAVRTLAGYRPDVVVTGAYGLILPPAVLAVPRLGCVNLHASLLPRWRGAAPIERAILAGDRTTGVCLFRMEAGLDTGPVYMRGEVPITDVTTAGDLHRDLAELAAALLVPTLEGIRDGTLRPVPQPDDGITYAAKLRRDEARLDFTRPASALARQVRAFSPRPGAYFMRDAERVLVHSARVVDARGAPGEIVAAPLVVACGQGALRLDVLQRPGRKALAASELLRGWSLPVGTRVDPA